MIKSFLKTTLAAIDRKFKTSFYQQASKVQNIWYGSKILNAIRRMINPLLIKLIYKFKTADNVPLKLHLGCGNRHLEGYINIDLRKTNATDLICNISKLPYPDNSVELIENYHVIEHLPRHDLKDTLAGWHRVLVPGGKLIIEFPNFDETVKRYLKGDEKQLDGIFGLQRFEGDYHLFGYNVKRLSRSLEESGFTNIEEKHARDYHTMEWPCLRIECMKDLNSTCFATQIEKDSDLIFNGERVVEGTTPQRIWQDHVARYEFAANHVHGKTVLDIACGTGYGSKILSDKGAKKVFGLDISNDAIDFAINHYHRKDLDFKVGNILKTDFPDNFFDVIVSFETIEHIKNNDKALFELRRVLKPRGLLIISSPNRKLTSPGMSIDDTPNNIFHQIEYSPKEFSLILSHYFEVSELYGQRAINKIYFIPFLGRILRRYLPQLYRPESGSYLVEKHRAFREYRYIIVCCVNSMK